MLDQATLNPKTLILCRMILVIDFIANKLTGCMIQNPQINTSTRRLFHMDHGAAGRGHKITREWRHGVSVHKREVIISIYNGESGEKED